MYFLFWGVGLGISLVDTSVLFKAQLGEPFLLGIVICFCSS